MLPIRSLGPFDRLIVGVEDVSLVGVIVQAIVVVARPALWWKGYEDTRLVELRIASERRGLTLA